MSILKDYIDLVRQALPVGTPEMSHYTALSNLFNEIGKTRKLGVRCIMSIKNAGAGLPDGGLFTKEQLKLIKDDGDPFAGKPQPARGVIEVKGLDDDSFLTSKGEQVSRYWEKYRQVLVTNLRDFLLIANGPDGQPRIEETYSLAGSKEEFTHAKLKDLIDSNEERFTEFLQRVMLRQATISEPEVVAWFLASYAREAKGRISEGNFQGLETVKSVLEESLGMKFEGEDGENFFRSSLVQTLFYGVFSAWVLWSREVEPTSDKLFDWEKTTKYINVPIIRRLYHMLAEPGQLKEQGLAEVLSWAGNMLNRVDRASFREKFRDEEAVVYFYEPFLKAFDPELRKKLGVWFTPPEIVEYMVERVDRVLRTELGLEDGLAHKDVYILDPCAGTGSFLIEVIKRIDRTLRENNGDDTTPDELKEIVLNRVFGFEILPAPFVVAHLQMGIALQKAGAKLKNGERAKVYLTNALTGWDERDRPGLPWSELEAERKGASDVKRDKPILVMLGNPPYNAFAGTTTEEEGDLVEAYKEGLVKEWGIKKFNLDELYIRFYRLAERRIAEMTGRGVVCYISNFSYLSDPSFVVMRKRFCDTFDKMWFDCLNGDSRETGKRTPDGKPDPSVFSTKHSRTGIRVGTAIGTLLLKTISEPISISTVGFRHFWGVNKRIELLNSLSGQAINSKYECSYPDARNKYSFKPLSISEAYYSWPEITELCKTRPVLGILDNRKNALIDIDKEALKDRMKKYFDAAVSWDDLKEINKGFTTDAARFDAKKCRMDIIKFEKCDLNSLQNLLVKPFDIKWCYYSSFRPLWNESRPQLNQQYFHGNLLIGCRKTRVANPEGSPFTISENLIHQHCIHTDIYCIPVMTRENILGVKEDQNRKFWADGPINRTCNVSEEIERYLNGLNVDPDKDFESAALIWYHVLAIGYSPLYLTENEDGVRQGWPRIPLPASKEDFFASAKLGESLSKLLLPDTKVAGIDKSPIRDEIKVVGNFKKENGSKIDAFAVSAGWGYRTKSGIVMPGRGLTIKRPYTESERSSIVEGAFELGLSEDQAFLLLGGETYDIYLNADSHWHNIPEKVWDYHIGGYQVLKKWLAYREGKVLGRSLHREEVQYFKNVARRLTALILMQPELDENYKRCKVKTYQQ